ncbi:MAG: Abi-alpha family protein [Bacteroidota bacterium]
MEEIEKKGLEKLMNKAFEFIDVIIKPPLQEVGGLLTDQVKFWRYKNQVDILIKAKEYHDQKGIAPKKIPVKTLVNLIEAGSYEEDESLQSKWAAMLANATDVSNRFKLHHILIDILKQLSPLEVEVLDFMYNQDFEQGTAFSSRSYYSKYIVNHMFIVYEEKGIKKYKLAELDREQEKIVVDNFFRLNLIERYQMPSVNYRPVDKHGLVPLGENDDIRLTYLGFKFVEQCTFKLD